ncbi:thioesterase family protein [Ferruginibacter sp. HRS2-29]|uniref:acyl-CoA thioesterase n=1 Tax=Ferruginibacter sp. HRS2-29 TaxID=2487334 RepID=UPI0020CD7AB9|nr:acyl-CoA thioesterase [Ferruginibacter sp. HRS2-29]
MEFEKKVELRWSDLDPNFHVLHSKYYDFAANCRMAFLTEHGFGMPVMMKYQIGPILFREEAVFRKEIRYGDEVRINLKVKSVTADYSRWSMVHELWRDAETLAAVITVDGAWMNTALRKLAVPPEEMKMVFEAAPRTDDFMII